MRNSQEIFRTMRDRVSRTALLILSVALISSCAFDSSSLQLTGLDNATSEPSCQKASEKVRIDDASHLNQTSVAEVWAVPVEPAQAEKQLQELFRRAARERRHISIAGARHSLGGHTISPDGIVLDMLPFNGLKLDLERKILHVGAGARWSEVIPYLDQQGFSVIVMQSDNNFSIGGSLSVNCHGWQQNAPPLSSTVESFRLMKADGSIVRCSRTADRELFSLAIGGYGLFGVILEVDLRVVPNERYQPKIEFVKTEDYVAKFHETIAGKKDVPLAYGRLCVVPGKETFLRHAIMSNYHCAPCAREEIPSMKPLGRSEEHYHIFRAQIGSQEGKENRWKLEKQFCTQFAAAHYSRNQLLNQSAETYLDKDPSRTDIIQEYFVPATKVEAFLTLARGIIPRNEAELLNVTVRNVEEDKDAFLRYADQPMFAFVMMFSQQRTPAGEKSMQNVTRDLIDAALNCEGRYYLPYRLHATSAQFAKAYPRAREFFAKKRTYDPEELFQNQFYLKYAK